MMIMVIAVKVKPDDNITVVLKPFKSNFTVASFITTTAAITLYTL